MSQHFFPLFGTITSGLKFLKLYPLHVVQCKAVEFQIYNVSIDHGDQLRYVL